MKYLLQTVETYRVDDEKEVESVINEAKTNSSFILKKYDRTFKERKVKGEVVSSYYILKLTKGFNEEKDPISEIDITYEEV